MSNLKLFLFRVENFRIIRFAKKKAKTEKLQTNSSKSIFDEFSFIISYDLQQLLEFIYRLYKIISNHKASVIFLRNMCNLRWNLKNLSRGLNPPKPGLNSAPA